MTSEPPDTAAPTPPPADEGTGADAATAAATTGAGVDAGIVLSRIYTRTGDDGSTALGDGSRVRKTSPRITAYADVDEANAAVGVAIALGAFSPEVEAVLLRVQNELFDVGADLATPIAAAPAYPPLRIDASYVTRLEADCDASNAGLPVLRSFVLPGGSAGSALLHVARTVTRRAERSAWTLVEQEPDRTSTLPATYLNRLSDLLFILGRLCNGGTDVLWRPGGERRG